MGTITGTSGADTLTGTTSADTIFGLAGNDTISGLDGNDIIDGGAGADSINGGAGTDTVTYANSSSGVTVDLTAGTGLGGDAQGDTLTSIEWVVGSAYGDTLSASTSGYTLQGGAGNDIYIVGNAGVVINEAAGEGTDEVRTSLASYSIANLANVENLTYTGSVAFTGTGNSGNNVITGGNGNDTLIGGAGADQLIGGAGTDIASYAGATAAVRLDLKGSTSSGDAAGDTFSGIEKYVGSSLGDTFISGTNADALDGGAGSDTIDYSTAAGAVSVDLTAGTGSAGEAAGDTYVSIERVIGSVFADTLSASTSAYILQGGAGDDVYVVGNAGVVVTEAAGEGTDEVRTALATLSIAGYANVEKLTYTGSAAFTGTGNSADNVITGGAGNDTLIGGGGADQLIGGAGTDIASYAGAASAVRLDLKGSTSSGDAAGDTFSGIEKYVGSSLGDTFISGSNADAFDGGSGTDTIDYSTAGGAVIVDLTAGTGSAGEAAGDTYVAIEHVIGSSFNDTLAAATSGYSLEGGAGNDTYILNGAGVSVVEAAGAGTDEVRTNLATLSIASFANVENLTYTGAAAFTGTGNSGNNVITGGVGNDTLIGGAGADQLIGGAGTDIASYAGAASAVRLDLKGSTSSGDAAGDTFSGIEKYVGSSLGDTFISGTNADAFDGASGADTIDYSTAGGSVTVDLTAGIGSAGEAAGDTYTAIEHVIGSSFDDNLAASTSGYSLEGGAGNDTYTINGTGVSVIEAANAGTDEIRTNLATFSVASSANVENLTYTGTAAFTGTGNASANVITGGTGNDVLTGGGGADQLIGGAGLDTASYLNSTSGLTIDLKFGQGTFDAAGDTYVGIEKFQGSAFNDVFIASAAAEIFDGAGGPNTLNYATSSAAVTIDVTAGTGSGGDAQGDTFTSIAYIVGSAYDDNLASATSGTTLQGNAGNDVYTIGVAGVTVVESANGGSDEERTALASLALANEVENLTYTGTASFTGTGNSSNNIITGGAGDDLLIGGAGADQLIGGAGTDTASYSNAAAGVSLNLKTGVYTGDAAGDTFSSIEKFQGSGFADTFVSGANADFLDGGAGTDTVDYSTSSLAVSVDLTAGTGSGGDAAGDTYLAIEGAVGSSFNDTLTGATTNDQLSGGAGNDIISAGAGNDTIDGGAGADAIDGGSGTDLLTYANSASAVAVDLTAQTATGGDATGDTITGIEQVIGSAYADNLSSSTSGTAMQGGLGDDVYVIGSAGVSVIEAAGAGSDEERTTLSALTLASNIEKLTFLGTGNFTGTGNISDNVITGGSGDDVLIGSGGADQLIGGAGTDTASYNNTSNAVTLNLKTGVNTGDATGDTFSSIEKYQGSLGNDTFVASAAADILDGASGTDTIDYSTSGAAVTVDLTSGVGSGGDAAGDILTSFERVVGSSSNDSLSSSTAATTLEGGTGNDTYIVGAANVAIVEGAGAGTDEVRTALAALNISAFANVENLTYTGSASFTGTGNSGDNIITGGAGNDTLIGGAGADQLLGGAGTDTASYADNTTGVSLDFKTGTFTGDAQGDIYSSIEKFQGSQGNDIFVSGAGADLLDGYSGTDTIDYSGSAAAVTVDLTAGTANGGDATGDVLSSFERVNGSAFADTLSSSTSGHVLAGGAGDDIYIVGNQGVSVVEAAGSGTDEVRTSLATLSMATYANVEKLTYTGSAAFTGTGNSGNNIITGGVGNDTLVGGAGADQLIGGAGTDTASYINATTSITFNLNTRVGTGDAVGDTYSSIERFQGSNAGDIFIASNAADLLDGAAGNDTIDYSGSASAVTVDLTAGTGSGGDAAGDVLTSFENVIGTSFADTLSSSTSGTTLQGGGGDDVYIVGAAGVTIVEASGAGNDEVRSALANFSIATFANVEKLTYTGSVAFTGTGNSGDNIITGGAGNDTLIGGGGADQLIGGSGTDVASYSNATSAVTLNLKTGANTGDATGDTFTSIEKYQGSAFDDTFVSGAAADALDGAGGADTADYSLASGAVALSLTSGTGTAGDALGDTYTSIENVLGSAFADTIAGSSNADRISGGAGNDVLTGAAGDDIIEGGAGADSIDGGAGTDTASYAGSASAVTVDITAATASGGDAAGDTLTAIEHVLGSAYADNLSAATSGYILEGGAGDDIYTVGNQGVVVTEGASSGTDTVQTALASLSIAGYANVENLTYTGSAAFTGTGNSGANVITGGSGNDTLAGGAGADQLVGGSGVDAASYAGSAAGLTVDFNGVVSTGDAFGDTYQSIERAIGSAFDDLFVADSRAWAIDGGNGFDIASFQTNGSGISVNLATGLNTGVATGDSFSNVEGYQGTSFADTLTGSASNEYFIGGDGGDAIDGGGGSDTVMYLDSSAAITADLLTHSFSGGSAAGDAVTNVENIIGSSFDDTIAGDALANQLEGAGGSDIIHGGDGDDTIIGGKTTDTGLAAISTGSGTDADQLYGDGGNDTLLSTSTASNSLSGGAGNDALTIVSGVAHGDDGDDNLVGESSTARLFGDAGRDILTTYFGGFMDGGEGDDEYHVDATAATTAVIQDTGTGGFDNVFLPWASTLGVAGRQVGNDLVIMTSADFNAGSTSGIHIANWFDNSSNHKTIELFVTTDHQGYSF